MKNILSLLLILISGTIYAQSGNWGLRQFETVVQLNAIFPSCATTSTAVNTSKLAYVNVTNSYYKWDCALSVWRPMADIVITTDAGVPSITCNSSTNVLVMNAAKNLYICDGTSWALVGTTVVTDATLAGDGSSGAPLKIAQQGASSGQVLKWNGTTWAPAADAGGGGGATDLAIGTVTSTTVQVTSSTGTAATIPAATTSLAGVLTAADKTNLDAVVAASHPAVTVTDNARIDLTLTGQNIQADLLQNGATSGQVMKWNGSVWAPANDLGTTYTGGTGIDVTGTVISNTDPDQSITNEVLTISDGTDTEALGGQTLTILGTGGATVDYVPGSNQMNIGFSEFDGDVQNEGLLSVTTATGNSSGIASNTTGSPTVILQGTAGILFTEVGNTITATAADPANDNEGKLSVSAGTASSAVINSNSPGSAPITIIAGTNVTISENTGTSEITINAAGGSGSTDLTIVGTSSPLTVQSSSGTGYTATAGTGISLAGTSTNMTITNSAPDQTVTITNGGGVTPTGTYPNFTLTAADVSATNELQTIANTSDATSHTATLSNTGGSLQVIEGTGINLTTAGTGLNGTLTIVNTAPDQVVALTGAGTTSVTGTYPNFTVAGTGISSTLTNNNILIGNGSNVATAVNPAGDWDITNTGTTTVTKINGVNVTSTGATANQLWRWNNGTSTWIPSDENTQQLILTGTTDPQIEFSDNSGFSGGAGAMLVVGQRGMVISNSGGDIHVALPTAGSAWDVLTSNGTGWSAQPNPIQSITVNPTSGSAPTLRISDGLGNPTGGGTVQVTGTAPLDVQATGSGSLTVLIAQSGAVTNDVLKWNGTNWAPAADATGSGGTNLTATGSAPNFNINSDTGTDVGIIQGAGATITRSGNDLTIATVDQSATNESLTVTDGTNSETLGGQTLTVTGSGGAVVSYNVGTNTLNINAGSSSGGDNWGSQVVAVGAGITGDGTGGNPLIATDASTTNELQTIANTSDATSHTATLSNSGGSTQYVEGSGVTLTTTGTSLNGVVTIGLTNPSYYHTLQEEGSSVTQRTALDFVGSAATLTDTGVKSQLAFDADVNALASNPSAGIYTITSVGNSTTRTITASTGITVTNGNGVSGNPTITNSAPDQTVVLNDGTGIDVTGTYPTFTVNATKVLREETFTATASQTAFTMAYSAPAVSGTAYPLRVYRNGTELNWVASAPTFNQYTYSGTTLTTFANDLSDVIRVNYLN